MLYNRVLIAWGNFRDRGGHAMHLGGRRLGTLWNLVELAPCSLKSTSSDGLYHSKLGCGCWAGGRTCVQQNQHVWLC